MATRSLLFGLNHVLVGGNRIATRQGALILNRRVGHKSRVPNVTSLPDKSLVDPPNQTEIQPIAQINLPKVRSEFHGVLSSQFNDDTKWYPIFRFPYARHSSILVRAKLYMTAAMGAGTIYNLYNLIMNQTLIQASKLSLCLLSLGAFAIVSNDLRQLVCAVYATEDDQFVRLARITFSGRRMDMILPVACLTPMSELNRSWRQNYLRIKVNPPKDFDYENDYLEFYDEKFKLTLRYGGILDPKRFERVFGRILRLSQ